MPLGGVQRFRSYDGGATWTALAPTPGGAETRAWHLLLAADPDNPNHVFVNDGYSLYESTDGGSSWSHADDGVGWIVANHGFDWVNLSFDASGDAIATADQGVLREHKPSTGKWTSLIGDLQVSEFYTITLDPNDTSVAYAVGQDLYSSKFTGGLAWDMLEDAVGEAGNFVVDPTNTQVVYGYNPLDPASFVRRSNDHGQSWTVICTPADVGGSDYGLAYDTQKAFVMDPSNHDRLLIGTTKILETKNASAASPTWNAISNVLTGDAQHVTARGRTFRREHDLCRDARRARLVHLRRRIALVPTGQRPERCRGAGVIGDLSIDPADAGHVYAVASGDVWELSTPAGGTPIWTRLTGAVPPFETGAALYVDWHAPAPVLYVGTDRGVYSSVDRGATWGRFGTNLPQSPVAAFASMTDGSTRILAAATHGRGAWEILLTAQRTLTVTVTPFGPPFGVPGDLALRCPRLDHRTHRSGHGGHPWHRFRPGTRHRPGRLRRRPKLYVTASHRSTRRGTARRLCTVYHGSHYPVATITAVGYLEATVALGPDAPAEDLPVPTCVTIPGKVHSFDSKLEEYLLVHGGDPLPEESPIVGLKESEWQVVRKVAEQWQENRRSVMKRLRARKSTTVMDVQGTLIRKAATRTRH